MKIRTQKWIVWLWAASLIIATTGISLHQIYCFCVGKRSVSIFHQPQDACLQDNTCTGGSSQSGYNCCKRKAPTTNICCKKDSSLDHDGSCARKTTQFFKLKTELQSPQCEQFDYIKSTYSLEALPVHERYLAILPNTNRLLAAASTDLPPPISGRSICLRYGVIRC
jgi:hypothetical protein